MVLISIYCLFINIYRCVLYIIRLNVVEFNWWEEALEPRFSGKLSPYVVVIVKNYFTKNHPWWGVALRDGVFFNEIKILAASTSCAVQCIDGWPPCPPDEPDWLFCGGSVVEGGRDTRFVSDLLLSVRCLEQNPFLWLSFMQSPVFGIKTIIHESSWFRNKNQFDYKVAKTI